MALASSVPKIQFTPQGLVIPAESAVLSGAQADINAAFGGGVGQGLETPQGQLATSQAACIADKNAQIAYLANQLDPTTADGVFQDSLGKLFRMTRLAASGTVVSCVLTGAAGSVIPAGAQAKDTASNNYILLGTVTLDLTGSGVGQFQNVATGAIPCLAGALNKVNQAVIGWDSVTNPTAGVLGRAIETRIEFEIRRAASVAANAQGSLPAIFAAVANVVGVSDIYVTENNTSSPVLVGSSAYPLIANSIYVAAKGGLDADIAAAILSKRAPCGGYNGNTSVVISDSVNYAPPYPTYRVTFNRPTATPVKLLVQILANVSLPADISTQIKNAIIASFNGIDGGARAKIGANIASGRFYGGVLALSPFLSVAEILLGLTAPTNTNITIGIDQLPTITASDITVQFV